MIMSSFSFPCLRREGGGRVRCSCSGISRAKRRTRRRLHGTIPTRHIGKFCIFGVEHGRKNDLSRREAAENRRGVGLRGQLFHGRLGCWNGTTSSKKKNSILWGIIARSFQDGIQACGAPTATPTPLMPINRDTEKNQCDFKINRVSERETRQNSSTMHFPWGCLCPVMHFWIFAFVQCTTNIGLIATGVDFCVWWDDTN